MHKTVRRPRFRSAISSPRVMERRGQTWEKLVAVAARLMADKGVAAISVEQIILSAGISRGTFYGYCGGKVDLIVAIMEPVFLEGTIVLEELAGGAPADVVPGIIDLYGDLWERHRNALLMIPTVPPQAFSGLRNSHGRFTSALRSALGRAATAGLLRSGSADYAFRVLTRTAVPLLRIYDDHPDGEQLYRDSMSALLAR